MYKIDRSNLKKEKKFHMTFFWVGLAFFILFNVAIIGPEIGLIKSDIESEGISISSLVIVWIFTGLFMKVGLDGAKKVDEKNKKYDYLEKNGVLVKGLTYTLQKTNMSVNDRPIMRIVADYELDSGSTIKLYGDGRFDRKSMDSDGLVDALIDPMNYENCFLDFNISEDLENFMRVN